MHHALEFWVWNDKIPQVNLFPFYKINIKVKPNFLSLQSLTNKLLKYRRFEILLLIFYFLTNQQVKRFRKNILN